MTTHDRRIAAVMHRNSESIQILQAFSFVSIDHGCTIEGFAKSAVGKLLFITIEPNELSKIHAAWNGML